MRTYIYKGESDTSGKIFFGEVKANSLAEAQSKARDVCYGRDLILIDVKLKEPEAEA